MYVRGYKLPQGTIIYYCNGLTVFRKEIRGKLPDILGLVNFCLVGDFWATKSAIGFWYSYPHRHPHSTLFGILYKKLEL
jgi:hypothetical protein